jgi:threonine dehydrogenase-like Zn-dependent dehydrogenase
MRQLSYVEPGVHQRGPQFALTTPVPLLAMYTKGITFNVSRAESRRYLPELAELVASGHISPAAVPTTVVPWEQADQAWLEPAIKLVIDRGEES